MIVIIILATIAVVTSRDSVENAKKIAFITELTDLKRGLDAYNQRAYYRGVETYNSEDLFWNGKIESSPENTAKIADQQNEDDLRTILGGSISDDLKGKIYIYGGELYVFKDKKFEKELGWVAEDPKFSYIIAGNASSGDINRPQVIAEEM